MYPIVYHVLHDKSIFHRQIRNFYTCPGKFCWNGARAFFLGGVFPCLAVSSINESKRIPQNKKYRSRSATAGPVHHRQHRTIPALRLKHRSGGCGTASALPKCSIMSGCGTRIVHRGQKPLALCDRCPCFGSLHPPLAALTFAASSIICAFGLAAAAPRSPYRHLELCGIAHSIFVC